MSQTSRPLIRELARQLREPAGLGGLLVARRLNRNNREMVVSAVEACRAFPGAHVADVGFGGGLGLSVLLPQVCPGGQVVGVDVSKTMVDRARRVFRRAVKEGTLRVQHGSAGRLELPDGSLDALVTVNTLYFMPDLGPPLREFARVLRPSGRVVVGIGDPLEMARLPVTAHGFILRPLTEVRAALADAGLVLYEQQRGGQPPHSFHLLAARRP